MSSITWVKFFFSTISVPSPSYQSRDNASRLVRKSARSESALEVVSLKNASVMPLTSPRVQASVSVTR